MDPVSAAIIAAVTAGVTQGLGETAKKAVADGYQKLKGLLAKRFGDESELVAAVDALEKQPESAARRAVVEEEVGRSGADRSEEALAAARELLDSVQQHAGASPSIQQAIGSNIAQADRHGHAEVNVNTRDT